MAEYAVVKRSFFYSCAEKYAKEKRDQGYKSFTIMHVLLASYIRTLSQRPYLNRFISGQKVYARNNIQVNLAVKRKMTLDETDTIIKAEFEPTDTAIEVYEKINKIIEDTVNSSETSFDKTAKIVNYIPGLVKKFAVHMLKTLDYFGLLPLSLTNVSPFHGSLFITSMGSLGIPPIYHHLYNFGNVPVFISFGAKYSQNEIGDDGSVVRRRYIDYTVVTDERICDGYAYSVGLKAFKKYLRNPYLLDSPPEEVFEDPDIDPKPKTKKSDVEKDS